MGLRILLLFFVLTAGSTQVSAQLASPPPVSGRASSSAPLSETFTPDTLFPKKPEPAANAPAPVIPIDADPGEILPATPRKKIWSGSGDIGLNGANGNSDFLNLRGGYNLRRKTETNALYSDFQYVFSQQSGVLKTSQALFNVRDEILFAGSQWSPFSATQVEYDEFRAYRFRVGIYAGTGYRLIDENGLTFKIRAGAGATREIGSVGNPDRWVPEFLFGYDFRYKINERSTLISYFDYYPRMENFQQYRLRARVAYEFILDPELALIYRIGIQDRYDSDPGSALRNDVTFFTTIGLKF